MENTIAPHTSELSIVLCEAVGNFTALSKRNTLAKPLTSESHPLDSFSTTDQNITQCLTNLIDDLYVLQIEELSIALNELPHLGLPQKYELLSVPPMDTMANNLANAAAEKMRTVNKDGGVDLLFLELLVI